MNTSKIKVKRHTVFKRNPLCKDKYVKYRIPGIIATKNDTLLAYYEARAQNSDWAKIDIVMLRSTDGGKTYAPEVCLVNGIDQKQTANNPVMIAGNDGIHFLYCVEYGVSERGGGVFYRKSSDDGLTFSEPEDISQIILPFEANVFALGPGHGICTKEGVLIVAVWFVKKSAGNPLDAHHPATVATVYSLDNGKTWQAGEEVPTNGIEDPNESTLVELDDGSIMLNARVNHGSFRAVSHSKNGYSDWTPLAFDKNLIDPTCFGSLTGRTAENGNHQAFFINCESQKDRVNLTLKRSDDNGKTWSKVTTLRKRKAGYADVTTNKKGDIFVAYEVNGGYGETIAKITTN